MRDSKDQITGFGCGTRCVAMALFTALFFFGAALHSMPGRDRILIVRGDHEYPPFEYLNHEGRPEGFNIDILNAIAGEMNLSVAIRLGPWEDVRRELELGRIDIITGMYYSPVRDAMVDFTNPHFIVSYGVFVNASSGINEADDLWSVRIIVQEGDIGCDYVRSQGMGRLILTRQNMADVLTGLSRGEADAAVASRLQGIMFIEKMKLDNIRMLDEPLFQRKYCMAVRQGDARLLNTLKEGLAVIKGKGEYARIRDRWFGVAGEDRLVLYTTIKKLIIAAFMLTVTAGAAILWSWTLRRRIRLKAATLQKELDERRAIEETLRETEWKYAAVVEKSGQVIFDWDIPSGRIMWAGAILKVTGYTERDFGEVSMDRFPDYIHPEDRPAAMDDLNRSMRSLERYDSEVRFRHGSGRYIFIGVRGFFLPDAGGKASRMLGTMVDVTERRRAEEEINSKTAELRDANIRLQRTLDELSATNEELEAINDELVISQREIVEMNNRLRESERRLSTLIGNLPGIVYRYRLHGDRITMEYLSRGCLDVTGYDADYLMRTDSGGLMGLVLQEDREMVMNQLSRLSGEEDSFDIHYRIHHGSGEIRWVWEKGLVIGRDHEGIILEGLVSDMTELERKDIQLRQAQKLEVIGTLAGGIAHDFNNLLGGIDGGVALVERLLSREKLSEGEKIGRYLEITRQASQRAAELVKQLLTLSRKQEPETRPVDVGNAMDSVVRICGNTFPREIAIIVRKPDLPVMVKGDPVQMEQVILNLCVNASHAMTVMREKGEKQGGTLEIKVDVFTADPPFVVHHPGMAPGDKYARITVRDTGVGMDGDTRLRLFEPFFTTKSKEQGTGLGLAIAFSIITGWGGFFDVESEPGEGSLFTVILPLTGEESAHNGEPVEPPDHPAGSGIVLVVDDENMMRTVAGGFLEEYGFTVMTAHNGEEGVALFREKHERIRAVVLDISMPVMSGEDACREMKSIDPTVPILLSSGFRRDERVEEAMALGVDGFIQKPYKPEELAGAIFGLIAAREGPGSPG